MQIDSTNYSKSFLVRWGDHSVGASRAEFWKIVLERKEEPWWEEQKDNALDVRESRSAMVKRIKC